WTVCRSWRSSEAAAHARRRFSSTRSGASPTDRPRLSEASAPSDVPPNRVLNPWCAGNPRAVRHSSDSMVGRSDRALTKCVKAHGDERPGGRGSSYTGRAAWGGGWRLVRRTSVARSGVDPCRGELDWKEAAVAGGPAGLHGGPAGHGSLLAAGGPGGGAGDAGQRRRAGGL